AKDIDTATKAPPDTAAAKDKDVTPLTPDQAPGNPGGPSATDAVPEKQPAAVTDFSEGPAQNDKAMADAEVTEEQLAKGNEPEFNEALSAKKTSEADAAKAPAKGKAAQDQQLSTAKQNAAASGAQVMAGLTATRATAGKQVDGGKSDTKSKDEKKRAEVTAKLQKVYDGTKKDVEDTLSGLDKKVDSAFTSGEKAARDAFTADHKSRMKKYKDKRYSGLLGKGRWIKDKFAGLPKAANDLYQESRKLYVSRMQTVISSVADIIGAELGRAKARIAKGRTELKAEVDRLPSDLKQFGQEAAKDFAGKFDDLEATVNEKSEQLVQDLAQKYTAALNKIDEEIKKLQEANKGLIDKAKDAIVGVIKTINELKNLLLGILAKAASAIMKIIKDPIGFLGNLVKAVGAGLNLFITNIADHLKTGVVSWLLGTAVKAGLDLPQKFDLKGIIQLIGSMLGLTWDNIRTRITRKGVPDEAMSAVETSVPVAKNLAAEGPAGAVKEIQAEAGDLKATILGKLTTYLIPTVLIAGITWIISLLNPASAFVRAVKGIIDIVTFIVTQGAQIADFVNAVLDAVIAIANGGQAGVPQLIETALASSVPLLIGFLAALLGIGGLANKVKSVFQSVSRPVTRAIDKIVDFITKKGKALWAKRKGKGKDRPNDKKDSDENFRDPKHGKSQKELEQLARKAAEEAHRRIVGGVSPAQAKSILREVENRYKRQGLISLSFISGARGTTSVRIRAKVNPEYSASDVDTVSLPGDRFTVLPWIHEVRGWATLNEQAAKMEVDPDAEAGKKKEWAPPTYARGIISWSDQNANRTRNTKTFESSSMGASDKKFMRSYPEAHGEEKVIQAFDRLLWGDYKENSLEGVVIDMSLFINRSSCVNCADFIAEFVKKLEKRGATVTAKANVTAPYRGGSTISEEVRKRNGDLIKQFASNSLITHEQLEKAREAAQKKNPPKPPPEPVVGRFWGNSDEDTRKRIKEVRTQHEEAQKDLTESTGSNSGSAAPPMPDEMRWHQLRPTKETQRLGVAILERAGVEVHPIDLDSLRSTNFTDAEVSAIDASADPAAAEIQQLAARRPDYQSLDQNAGAAKVEQQMKVLRDDIKRRTKEVNTLVADEGIQEIRRQAQERKEAEQKAAQDLLSGG
ncbi:hypothetical protein ACIREB_13265, partial [Streptomyces anulatus]